MSKQPLTDLDLRPSPEAVQAIQELGQGLHDLFCAFGAKAALIMQAYADICEAYGQKIAAKSQDECSPPQLT